MTDDQIMQLIDAATMCGRSLAAIAVAMWLGAGSTGTVKVHIMKDEEDE